MTYRLYIMQLNKRSEDNLKGVKEQLIKVVRKCAEKFDHVQPGKTFVITCGVRTLEQQKVLVATGKSQTMKSKHLTGDAVDVAVFVNGELTWDYKYYKQFADVFKQCAAELGTPIEWGGDWKSFVDCPHFQLKVQ